VKLCQTNQGKVPQLKGAPEIQEYQLLLNTSHMLHPK